MVRSTAVDYAVCAAPVYLNTAIGNKHHPTPTSSLDTCRAHTDPSSAGKRDGRVSERKRHTSLKCHECMFHAATA